jgi:hypothetical protein
MDKGLGFVLGPLQQACSRSGRASSLDSMLPVKCLCNGQTDPFNGLRWSIDDPTVPEYRHQQAVHASQPRTGNVSAALRTHHQLTRTVETIPGAGRRGGAPERKAHKTT